MRVLICGGAKTVNIVKSISPRFNSGSVQFITEISISNIEYMLNRGEYFDRAIIIEQSWTKDGVEQDELQMRQSISEFVTVFKNKCSKESTCIFVATTEKMAKIVVEETLEMMLISKVVLKEPPYAVSFFTTIVTYDLSNIPENYIFNIEDVEVATNPEEDELSYGDTLESAQDINMTESNKENNPDMEEIHDFDEEVFGDTQSTIEQKEIEEVVDDNTTFGKESNDEIQEDISYDTIEDIEDNNELDTIEIDDAKDNDSKELENNEEIDDADEIQDNEGYDTNEKQEDEDYDTIENIESTDYLDTIEIDDVIEETYNMPNEETNVSNVEVDNTNIIDNRLAIEDAFQEDVYENKTKNIVNDIELESKKIIEPVPIIKTGIKTKKVVENKKDISKLTELLDTFAIRGSSLVITGASASGKSTMAYNIANTIVKLGYKVLLVDMDTMGRAQAYLSKDAYEAVHSHDASNASLKMAISNPNAGIGRYVNIIAPGFHLLTMGLASDIIKGNEIAEKQKIIRFANMVITDYNYIVYDMPFESAVSYCSDVTFTADNIVMCVDSSNWGIMRALIAMSNIESEDMQEVMFRRAQICFTKYMGFEKVFGSKVKTVRDILSRMDYLIKDLLGVEPEFEFSNMGISGVIPFDRRYEQCVFTNTQFSDLNDGYEIMIGLIQKILLKK